MTYKVGFNEWVEGRARKETHRRAARFIMTEGRIALVKTRLSIVDKMGVELGKAK